MFGENWSDKLVDLNETKFKSINIKEIVYAKDDIEYQCKYNIDIKYHNVNTENKAINKYLNNNKINVSETIVASYKSRPKELFSMGVTKEDIKEDTVDAALNDFFEHSKTGTQLQCIWELFSVNIPKKAFEKACTGSVAFSEKRKVKDLEFDYRKHTTNYVTVVYDDGTSMTVNLKSPVTSDDTLNIVNHTLFDVYRKIEEWLEEDYDSTIEIIKNIFKFDPETLKGADIKC